MLKPRSLGCRVVKMESNMAEDSEAPPKRVCSQGTITLRALLEPEANEKFDVGGVADIKIETGEVDVRLAAMQVALVAHKALLILLVQVDVPEEELPAKLIESATKAAKLGLISNGEANWLKYINKRANKAKHEFNIV